MSNRQTPFINLSQAAVVNDHAPGRVAAADAVPCSLPSRPISLEALGFISIQITGAEEWHGVGVLVPYEVCNPCRLERCRQQQRGHCFPLAYLWRSSTRLWIWPVTNVFRHPRSL